MLDDLFSIYKKVRDEISDGTAELFNNTNLLIDRALDKQICIGVTGFSGSGKSTFITSLIHQLRYSNEAQLHGFLLARDQKILGINLLPLPDCDLFNYEQGISELGSTPPRWPKPTATVSGCVIEINYINKDSIANKVLGDKRKFNIEIRDYPGEWLLDLPLLEQDYWSWCQDVSELCTQSKRKTIIGDLLQDLQGVNPFQILTESEIESLYYRYSLFLQQCKNSGLTLIQPGRVLLADKAHGHEPFFPLLGLRRYDQETLDNADSKSVYKVMLSRYLMYVNQIVKPFSDDFFNKVDRKVVLIDVIKALSGGKDDFDDMLLALSRIMDSHSYGMNSFFKKLSSPDVERIVFLASKPDRVLSNQHENLRSLVHDIITRVSPQSVRNSIPIDTEVVSSVRCTQDYEQFLTGTSLEGEKGNLKHPDIPERIPSEQQWEGLSRWNPTELLPPQMNGLMKGARIPSIRMGIVLKDLIGDKF